jgi:hypothetical protein
MELILFLVQHPPNLCGGRVASGKLNCPLDKAEFAIKAQARSPSEENMVAEEMSVVLERLDRIEATLAVLVEKQTVKDWYSTDEVAKLLDKAEFTVREWCRLSRIHAEKKGSGRGKFQSWVISHAELLRIQREGILPLRRGA